MPEVLSTGEFSVDVAKGLVSPAKFVPSPNSDARPADTVIDLLVIHGISLPPGAFGSDAIEAFFTNTLDWSAHAYFEEIRGMEVSSHVLVRRDGAVVQFVPFTARAWHAGASSFHGREGCNDFSIGIELEGADDTPYDDRQYSALTALVSALMTAYPDIDGRRITGHSDIAPGRKTDPGPAFDWLRLYDALGIPLKP